MSRVLVIDDERSIREFLSILIRRGGHDVEVAADAASGLALIRAHEFDVIFTDLKMPGELGGMDVLRQTREISPSTQVIVLTAFATTETALEAMKLGAYDYVQKPFQNQEIEVILQKSLEKRNLLRENLHLRSELQSRYRLGSLIGKSSSMQSIFSLIERAADTKVNVLILGESGTGKELVARALHYNSQRKERPFVPINCGAIPENLLESELFGHVKGSFTGADRDKPGLFQQAEGGTIFLDEIGEMPLHIQVKLLRVLQDRKLRPVGGMRDLPFDVRVIAATNKRLAQEASAGRFREDLFFRLNVFTLEVPPLRQRRDDIPLLAQYFLDKFAREMQRPVKQIGGEALSLLNSYAYPGNVRELENIIERAVLLSTSTEIQPDHLPNSLHNQPTLTSLPKPENLRLPEEGLEPFLEQIEKHLLLLALKEAKGVRKDAAALLKLTFRSMRYRLAKFSMNTDESDVSDERLSAFHEGKDS